MNPIHIPNGHGERLAVSVVDGEGWISVETIARDGITWKGCVEESILLDPSAVHPLIEALWAVAAHLDKAKGVTLCLTVTPDGGRRKSANCSPSIGARLRSETFVTG